MNKLAVAGVAVSLAVLIGIPPVIGSFTEARVMEQAQQIETLTDNAYRLEVLDYEGGWFGSTARVRLSLGEEYIEQLTAMMMRDERLAAAEAAEMLRDLLGRGTPLVIEIGHGPVMLVSGLQVGLLSAIIRPDPDEPDLAALVEALEMPYLFEVRTRLGMTGTTTFAGDVPPFEMNYPDGSVDFSGFMVEGAFDLQARRIDSQGAMESLRVDGDWGSAAAEEFIFNADLTGFSPILWLGEVEMEVGSVTSAGVGPEGPFNLAMTEGGVHFDTAIDSTGELVTIEGRYYLDSLTAPDDFNLADASFAFAMRDFDRDALEAYYTYSRLVAVSPEAAPPLFPGIENLLYLTLASSPSLEIGPVEFRWNEQPFEANLRIDADGSGLPEREAFTMFNFGALLRAVSAEAYAETSEELAHMLAVASIKRQLRTTAAAAGAEIPAADLDTMAESQAVGMLLGLVLQNLIATSDVGYRSDLTFMNGELRVNGNVVPLGAFM